MSKDCICITAYKSVEGLRILLEALYTDFDCYVHVDKRVWDRSSCLRLKFGKTAFFSEYATKWGSVEHLKAILLLFEESYRQGYRYIHVISGEDYPILPNKALYDSFKDDGKIYLSFELTTNRKNHANRRWRYYWPYTKFSWDYKKTSIRILNLLFVGMQILFPFCNRKKIGDLEEIYGGGVYGSYPRGAAAYILDHLKENPHFMKDLCWCKILEGLCFQTILMRSHLREFNAR